MKRNTFREILTVPLQPPNGIWPEAPQRTLCQRTEKNGGEGGITCSSAVKVSLKHWHQFGFIYCSVTINWKVIPYNYWEEHERVLQRRRFPGCCKYGDMIVWLSHCHGKYLHMCVSPSSLIFTGLQRTQIHCKCPEWGWSSLQCSRCCCCWSALPPQTRLHQKQDRKPLHRPVCRITEVRNWVR